MLDRHADQLQIPRVKLLNSSISVVIEDGESATCMNGGCDGGGVRVHSDRYCDVKVGDRVADSNVHGGR